MAWAGLQWCFRAEGELGDNHRLVKKLSSISETLFGRPILSIPVRTTSSPGVSALKTNRAAQQGVPELDDRSCLVTKLAQIFCDLDFITALQPLR